MPSKIKITKGQQWRPKRGVQWARIAKVLPTGRIEVEKHDPTTGERGRTIEIAEASLRRDYALLEGAT